MSKYIIVGPGASGKDWLLKKMVEIGYQPMKQYTTREKRENETGDEYHFVSETVFKDMDDRGQFISVNFYRIGWYGVSYDELINSSVAILSPANVKDVFTLFPELRDRFTIIYLDIPVEIGDDNEKRIAADTEDFKDFNTWDLRFEDVKSIDEFINKLFRQARNIGFNV